MADINNTGITGDDIQKTKDYAAAIDKLHTSISGVNSALPEFSDGLKAGLKAVGEKLPDVVDAMMKLNLQNKELVANGQKPVSVLSQLASSMLSWNSVVSVGITLLATYGGAIIDWVGKMIKGETTLSAFAKAMKENAIITNALIQTKLEGDKAAQSELTTLTALYNATQKQTDSKIKQKEAVKALRDQWPDTFKNLKDEEIMTGKAADAYKKLKEQIMDAAYAEAAKNRITANAGRDLGNNFKIEQERAHLKDLLQQQKALGDDNIVDIHAAYENQVKIDKINDDIISSGKLIQDLKTDKDLLGKQNDALYKEIENRVKKHGVSVLGYKDKPTQKIPTQKTNTGGVVASDIAVPLDTQKENAQKALQQTAEDFNKKLEQEHNNYAIEQQALQTLLDNKLISQEDFHTESEQLEEKYHVGIGEKIKRFNQEDLATAQKQQQDLIAAHKHQDKMDKDEHEVKKAILPADKLAAEKQLIMDKYDFELQQAAAAGKDTLAIREQYQQEITAITNRYEEERKAFALQTAQKVSDTAFNMLKGSIQSQADAKIKGLETQKQAELNNSSLTADQKRAIEDKYKKKEAGEKVKAFKAEQKASILQAVINGALAITKATSQTGVLAPFVIPGIIVETALQVATIAKQKAPQYAKGGVHYKSDGRGALLSGYSRTDDTNAYLRSGEAVVVSEAMRNPWARNLVSAINVAHGGRDFSMSNPGRGYAIGGVFTDGGNANRYYSQPANDAKDLANTLAYQMINNFPPIYVDVKDVNNQQNILAQTVNRVNL